MWKRCNSDALVNFDNVEKILRLPECGHGATPARLDFWLVSGDVHEMAFDCDADAQRTLDALYEVLRREDEQRHGAARHCSVCVERCEEAK